MRVALEPASEGDAAAIAALRLSCARDLTARFGNGTWSFAAESEGGVRLELRASSVYVVRDGPTIVASLRLSQRSPWLGPVPFFTVSERPLFLTAMVVRPERQRTGIGRQCLADLPRVVRELGGDALRLDTYDGPAGAAEFYRRGGFREVGRAPYHGTPLVFFERRV